MKSVLYIASLVFAIIAIGALSYNYISTEPTTNVITKSSDTNNTGIKVNGEWELTVYNKDGSIEETHEFTNDLTDEGKELLLALLTGQYDADPNTYPISWVINIDVMGLNVLDNVMTCTEFNDEGTDLKYASVTIEGMPESAFTISSACTLKEIDDTKDSLKTSYIGSVRTEWCFSSCFWYNTVVDGIKTFGGGTFKGELFLNQPHANTGDFTQKLFDAYELPVTEGQMIATNVKISFK